MAFISVGVCMAKNIVRLGYGAIVTLINVCTECALLLLE